MRSALVAGLALIVLLCTGCASVTHGTTHPMRIETVTAQGEQRDGSDCTLVNNKGTTLAKSGASTMARRSGVDLDITCTAAGLPDAKARLVSRGNAGLAGNIIIGGAIGAVVDHNTGAAYTYPGWVRLVFGESRVFDRRDEREGVAMDGPGVPLHAEVATAAAPAEVAAEPVAVVQGDSFGYRVTDRATGRQRSVVLRAERVDAAQASFNDGARVEDAAGAVVRLSAALLGELDQVTPPGGWLRHGRVPTGQWKLRHRSIVPTSTMSYDLDASSEGEATLRVDGRTLRVQRIALRGWVQNNAGMTANRAVYEARAWISPQLRRVVRFETRARASGNAGGGYFQIDELSELVRIGRD